MALPPEIQDLDEYTETINWLIYGDSGVGKTVLAGELPNAIFLSAERGTVSAKRRGSNAKVWPIKRWEDMVKAFEFLQQGDHNFEWVIIDSVTEVQQKCLDAILKDELRKKPTRDKHKPELQDYFKWQLMFKEMVNDFTDNLNINVCWLGLSMHREDAEGEELVLPQIQGKDYEIAMYVCGRMDILSCLRVKKVKDGYVRELISDNMPPFLAKNRYGVAGRIANPTMQGILAAIGQPEKKPVAKRAATKAPARRRRAAQRG